MPFPHARLINGIKTRVKDQVADIIEFPHARLINGIKTKTVPNWTCWVYSLMPGS